MSMKKRIILTLAGLTLVVGILGGIKGLQIDRMIAQGSQMVPPPEAGDHRRGAHCSLGVRV